MAQENRAIGTPRSDFVKRAHIFDEIQVQTIPDDKRNAAYDIALGGRRDFRFFLPFFEGLLLLKQDEKQEEGLATDGPDFAFHCPLLRRDARFHSLWREQGAFGESPLPACGLALRPVGRGDLGRRRDAFRRPRLGLSLHDLSKDVCLEVLDGLLDWVALPFAAEKGR